MEPWRTTRTIRSIFPAKIATGRGAEAVNLAKKNNAAALAGLLPPCPCPFRRRRAAFHRHHRPVLRPADAAHLRQPGRCRLPRCSWWAGSGRPRPRSRPSPTSSTACAAGFRRASCFTSNTTCGCFSTCCASGPPPGAPATSTRPCPCGCGPGWAASRSCTMPTSCLRKCPRWWPGPPCSASGAGWRALSCRAPGWPTPWARPWRGCLSSATAGPLPWCAT